MLVSCCTVVCDAKVVKLLVLLAVLFPEQSQHAEAEPASGLC